MFILIQRRILESIGTKEKKFHTGRKQCLIRFFSLNLALKNLLKISLNSAIIISEFFRILDKKFLWTVIYFGLSAFQEKGNLNYIIESIRGVERKFYRMIKPHDTKYMNAFLVHSYLRAYQRLKYEFFHDGELLP